jgi:hypothetical protein
MAYVLTDGSNVKAYPYNIGLLRRDNPNVSFPASMADATLADWNVFPVADAAQPAYDPLTQRVVEGQPARSGDAWTQTWVVEQLSAAEAAQAKTDAMFNLRDERTKRLAESDWTQMADAPLTEPQRKAYAAYRQQLRDLPENTEDLLNPIWPAEPKVQ